MTRTAILGLDGATFRIIDEFRDSLPTLSTLIKNGYSAPLKSTHPPITSVAWPALATGQNPGRYGIFDFMYRKPNELSFELTDVRRMTFDCFWQYLDKPIGIASVPMVPYRDRDGFFIQGSLARINEERIVNPLALSQHIPDEYDYHIDPEVSTEEIVENVFDKIEARKRFFYHLVGNHDLPLYFLVFSVIDHVQHHFWAHHDSSHPAHEKTEYEDVIIRVYEKVDEALAGVLERLPEDCNIFVVSDHGFGPLRYDFNVNAVLEEQGYLQYEFDTNTCLTRILRQGKEIIGQTPLYGLIPGSIKASASERMPEGTQIDSAIDWSQTKAYSFGAGGHIYINLSGREKEGIVAERQYEALLGDLTETFQSLRNDGDNVIDSVHRGSQIYEGRFQERAPDLVIKPADGYHVRSTVGSTKFTAKTVTMPNSGMHESTGIFIASGPDISSAPRSETASIMDIAPTLLHLFGSDVPHSMDGTVLTEALEDDRPVNRSELQIPERRRIQNRVLALKQLGKI